MALLDDDARVFSLPILWGSPLALMCSRVERGHRDVVEVLILLHPRRLPWWGLNCGYGPLRTASGAGGGCCLGRLQWASSS